MPIFFTYKAPPDHKMNLAWKITTISAASPLRICNDFIFFSRFIQVNLAADSAGLLGLLMHPVWPGLQVADDFRFYSKQFIQAGIHFFGRHVFFCQLYKAHIVSGLRNH